MQLNVFDQSQGAKHIPVVRELPEDTIETLLNGKDLAAFDVAVFFYDRRKVAKHCKDTGFVVPFRYVAAEHCPLSFVLEEVGQDAQEPLSTGRGDSNDVFYEIAKTAGGGATSIIFRARKYLLNFYFSP